jgi:hypothetical protein
MGKKNIQEKGKDLRVATSSGIGLVKEKRNM